MTLSGSSLATSPTGFGLIAGGTLVGFAAILGIISASSSGCRKHLAKKVAKHEKTVTPAMSKQNTVSELVSKALSHGEISDREFQIVLRQVETYHSMKDDLRNNVTEKNNTATGKKIEREKIKKELRQEVRKKPGSLAFD